MIQKAPQHPEEAAKFVANGERAYWHDASLWFVRSKRDKQAKSIPEWETLREKASEIKRAMLGQMGDLLEQFEKNAKEHGAIVHWAKDAEEHNKIVVEILKSHNVKKVVKSKSMLTEECHLNPYLERNDIEVIDSDLGERIVQLRRETPSHIVLPAIHLRKEEVGDTFHEHLGTEKGASDPKYLTEAARQHLRKNFMSAEAGLTGVNFGIAETGGVVICTNEGNADLGTSLPNLHIASMGLEKMIPRQSDLGVFTRLLARSATGQPITTYTSHFHGPKDSNSELHIILVDNGRTDLLGTDDFFNALKCIRCGACMNTCPVYRRSGGHSYNSTVPGPIGSILSPARDPKAFYSLPQACSLCGSCTDVCPVKIDIHHQLYTWRSKLALKGLLATHKRMGMWFGSFVMKRTWLFNLGGWFARKTVPLLPRFMVYNNFLNPWGRQREIPKFPKKSFRQLYNKRKKK